MAQRKQRKRGNAEGSIYKMQDGRWRAAVVTGRDADGRLKRKIFTAATRHEVADELTKALRDRQRGINIDPKKRTVADFLDSWLQSIKRDVSPATYVSYEGAVRLHLKPGLGKILLSKLRPDHVQEFKQAKLEAVMSSGPGVKKPTKDQPAPEPRHLSAKTVQYLLLVLRMALGEACKLDLIPRNVAELVDFPKIEHPEIRPYTPEEAQNFLLKAKEHRLGALFSAAIALGLRKGEALALKWSAIDFERGTLSVKLSLQRIKLPGEKKGKLLLKEPKRSSRRTLNIPQVVLSELIQHRQRQEQERILAGSRWKDSEFVFTSGIGTPLEPRNVERAFSEIRLAAGLPRVRIHDLRHTAATLLLAQGVHPRVVMELLGHSQIAITMNTYSHVVPALRKDAADKMDAILNPPPMPVATSVATRPPSEKPN
ncbi:MAG: site-specific integrase [Acidobacteria bacterium]|nr:site-specific integrase [Acidobacteriota bacterium]